MIQAAAGGGALAFMEAADGRAGLGLARMEPQPDLILLDLQMPDVDGYRFLDEAASDPALRSVPVVVITSSFESGGRSRLSYARAIFSKRGLLAHGLPAELRQLIDETAR
jgi:CheY-like chemotaxis protein